MASSSPIPAEVAETKASGIRKLIRKRQPGVLRSIPADLSALSAWTDLNHLCTIGGEAIVKVEPIDKARKQYGSGAERQMMRFDVFLDELQAGKHLYLTTQYEDEQEGAEDDGDILGMDEDDIDVKACFPGAIRSLLSHTDIPLVPSALSGLALASMNLWLGQSRSGASSGLHHDYHDNLYILLKGRKRFVLYPPTAATHLQPYGTVEKVYKNGLIVYADSGNVRQDGLDEMDALKYKVKALERLKDKKITKDKKERKRLEKEYEEAVEAMMEAAMEDEAGLDDFDNLGEDDFDNMDGLVGADEEDGSDGSECEMEDAPSRKRPRLSSPSRSDPSDIASSEPDSFSQIPADQLHAYLGLSSSPIHISPANRAALQAAGQPLIVHLQAGNALYLPASWWHEVTSFGSEMDVSDEDGLPTSKASTSNGKAQANGNTDGKGKGKKGDGTKSDDNVHMAFNYWFHPPDRPKAGEGESMYKDERVWDYVKARVEEEYIAIRKSRGQS